MRRLAIKGNVPLSFFKESDMFVAHSTALDLSTCGKTFAEAEKNFREALQIFFEECVNHGTLDKALQSLGWHRQNKNWVPPVMVGLETIPLESVFA